MNHKALLLLCAAASAGAGGCFGGFSFDTAGPAPTPATPYDPCAAGAVIDLDARGERVAEGVRFVGSNAAVSSLAPLASTCGNPNGHQVVFRYTPRRAGRLYVTTNSPQTDADTVVWVLDRCAPAGAELGCNDDGQESPQPLGSTMITTAALPAGAPVFIVVAGFRGGRTPAQGGFALTVTELAADGADGGACRANALACDGATVCARGVCRTPLALGAACEDRVPCVVGASCGTDAASARVCVADGQRGGRCRTAPGAEPCDAGLGCGRVLFGEPVCGVPAPVGAVCDAANPVCVAGATCSFLTQPSRCVSDGALGGRCRAGGLCDVGLACIGNLACGREVALGAACNGEALEQCVAASDCVGGRCVARGARGGMCREAGAPCDAGLTCRGARCAP
ncbi:MAG: hypothetical protein U0324_36540 [Polyangiales bacterium]